MAQSEEDKGVLNNQENLDEQHRKLMEKQDACFLK